MTPNNQKSASASNTVVTMADTYLPIPSLDYRYEIDIHGNIRNAETKKLRKLHDIHGTKICSFFGGKCERTVSSLLHEVHGIIHTRKFPANIAVTIAKDNEVRYFKSFRKCAVFLANIIHYSEVRVKYFLTKRQTDICGWKIKYHEPEQPQYLSVQKILRR